MPVLYIWGPDCILVVKLENKTGKIRTVGARPVVAFPEKIAILYL